MLPTTDFTLRSANGIRNSKCSSRTWNDVTVRHLTNVASLGRVSHDLSSDKLTVAVLLDQFGGIVETRHQINRPLPRERYGAGQIDFIPAGISVWGVAESLRSTRSLRLYLSADVPMTLLGDELNAEKITRPMLMRYDERVYGCASLLAEECDNSSFGSIYGESLTLALVVALFSSQKISERNKRYGLARWQLRQAIEYFESHLAQDILLQDVATVLGLSQSRFARGFKNSTGVSPYRWCTIARIKRVKELLVENAIPLSIIAERTGFADQSHLTRAFKKVVGTAPRSWHHNQ